MPPANLYIADAGNDRHRIRKVDAQTKSIPTVAGSATDGYSCDNASAVPGPGPRRRRRGPATDPARQRYDRHHDRAGAQLQRRARRFSAYDLFLDTVAVRKRSWPWTPTRRASRRRTSRPNTKYYWKVRAKGDPFCPAATATSAVFWSTTAADCGLGSFDLIAPANATTVASPVTLLSGRGRRSFTVQPTGTCTGQRRSSCWRRPRVRPAWRQERR